MVSRCARGMEKQVDVHEIREVGRTKVRGRLKQSRTGNASVPEETKRRTKRAHGSVPFYMAFADSWVERPRGENNITTKFFHHSCGKLGNRDTIVISCTLSGKGGFSSIQLNLLLFLIGRNICYFGAIDPVH